jgi:23S rRNA pseudouridine1911/1915/1917 synthase
VHLAALGHPIVGDAVYGRTRSPGAAAFARQALHAEQIRFRHPRTGAELTVRAPLPADLAALLAGLRQAGGRTKDFPRSA